MMNDKELFRKCQLVLIIAFAAYPLVMLVLNRLAPELLDFGWLFSTVYVALALLGIQVKGRWRMTAGLVMSAAFVALSVVLAPEGTWLGVGAAAVLCSGLLIWSLKMGGWSGKQEVAVLWVACGIISHFLGQMSVYTDRVRGGGGLSGHAGCLMAALFGFVLLTMLSMNRNGLNVASGKRQTVPEVMRRKNAMMVIVLFLAAVLAALLPSVLSGTADVLKQGVLWLLQMLEKLFPPVPPVELDDGIAATENLGQIGSGVDAGITMNPIVEKIALFVGAVLSVLMLLFLCWQIIKFLRGGIQKLFADFEKFAASVSEDYIDEVTDTRVDFQAEKLEKKRRSVRMPLREPKDLAPEEKVRFRYRRLMHKHPEWNPGSTARETLPGSAAALYERARYSDHPLSEKDAAAFADGIKNV